MQEKLRKTWTDYVKKKDLIVAATKIQSAYRAYKTVQNFGTLRNMFGSFPVLISRNATIRELIKTEESYLQNLRIMTKEYFWPCRELIKREALDISNEDLSGIFSNVESLLEVHEEIFTQLYQKREKWPILNGVGVLFIEKLVYFNLGFFFTEIDALIISIRRLCKEFS